MLVNESKVLCHVQIESSTECGSAADVQTVKNFPEVLACSVEGRLKANVAVLESKWKMKKAAITGCCEATAYDPWIHSRLRGKLYG